MWLRSRPASEAATNRQRLPKRPRSVCELPGWKSAGIPQPMDGPTGSAGRREDGPRAQLGRGGGVAGASIGKNGAITFFFFPWRSSCQPFSGREMASGRGLGKAAPPRREAVLRGEQSGVGAGRGAGPSGEGGCQRPPAPHMGAGPAPPGQAAPAPRLTRRECLGGT